MVEPELFIQLLAPESSLLTTLFFYVHRGFYYFLAKYINMNWYKKLLLSQTYEEVMSDPETYSDPDDPEYFESYRYFSIGQGEDADEESYCWIFDGRDIEAVQGGTHGKNFPHLFSWERETPSYVYRGWYDPSQKMISVVIPRARGQVDPALKPSSLPTKLRVALGDEFGTDNRIMVF